MKNKKSDHTSKVESSAGPEQVKKKGRKVDARDGIASRGKGACCEREK